jgi:hypothetical protein
LFGEDEMKYKAEIRKIYKDYCQERNIKFSEKDFRDFLEFLEIDFYDWVKENLKYYFREKN